jgi:hypothetical protein
VVAVVAVVAAMAAVIVVAAVIAVGATVVEEAVAGSPLDHEEVLELLSQPVDREGEILHARVLVHTMMHLDVEGLANTFKLPEGAPEQLDGELSVVELLSTAAFVVVVLPSFPLRRRWAPRRHLLLLSVIEDL